MIQASHVTVKVGQAQLLTDVSMTVDPGEFVAILGPNGAGKTTLLSALSGERRVNSGEVRLDGRSLDHWPTRELSRRRAVMLQHSALVFAFTVAEVVALGSGRSVRLSGGELQELMEAAHVAHLAQRSYTTLSGGERQRVHFARALAQLSAMPTDQKPLLLLDEPTSSLDPGHQHLLMSAAKSWMARNGGTVIAVLHDLTLAAQYADRVVLLVGGKIRWQGSGKAIPDAVLEEAYGLSFCRVEISNGEHSCYVSMPPRKRLLN